MRGRSVAGLTRQIVDLKIAGSNPVVPAKKPSQPRRRPNGHLRGFFKLLLLHLPYGHQREYHSKYRDCFYNAQDHQVVSKAFACFAHGVTC